MSKKISLMTLSKYQSRISDMTRKFFIIIFTVFISFIMGMFICFMMTPIWWKLEVQLGIELAGHSGPEDWLAISFSSLFALAGVGFSWKFIHK